jgi:hypothetical protein
MNSAFKGAGVGVTIGVLAVLALVIAAQFHVVPGTNEHIEWLFYGLLITGFPIAPLAFSLVTPELGLTGLAILAGCLVIVNWLAIGMLGGIIFARFRDRRRG